MRIADDAGTLAGLPLLSCAGAAGLTLVSGQHVALAMADRVRVARSEQANIEMSDAPESDTADVVNLWQKNLVALKVEMFANWTVFGPSDSNGTKACVTLTSATWT
jgi:hypothetical protein